MTVLPSLNRTESFGLVQVESMLDGTPVVASNLPGVRVPVQTTGMGLVVPIGDTAALAEALIRILSHPGEFSATREEVEEEFSVRRTADDYERLFERLVGDPSERPRMALRRRGAAFGISLFAAAVAVLWPSRKKELRAKQDD